MDENFMKTDHNMLQCESNAGVYFDQCVGPLFSKYVSVAQAGWMPLTDADT